MRWGVSVRDIGVLKRGSHDCEGETKGSGHGHHRSLVELCGCDMGAAWTTVSPATQNLSSGAATMRPFVFCWPPPRFFVGSGTPGPWNLCFWMRRRRGSVPDTTPLPLYHFHTTPSCCRMFLSRTPTRQTVRRCRRFANRILENSLGNL